MAIMKSHTTEQSQTVRNILLKICSVKLTHKPSAANPNCAQAIMQWQHGTYTKNANNSLSLEPFSVDGRQLYSSPCEHDNAVFTRYSQSEYIRVGVRLCYARKTSR